MESLERYARTWFDRVWNEGDESAIDAMMEPDAVIHGLAGPGGDTMGRDGFHDFFRVFHGAFAGIKVTVDEAISAENLCAVRFHFTGTHTGDQLGVPATHRQVAAAGMVFIKVINGRIVEGWNCVDMLGLMKQIGGV